jgi:hypothetical protein
MSRSFTLTALAFSLLALPALAQEVTPHYFNVPGTDTKLKIYGFVQMYGEYYVNQTEYMNGSLIDGYSSQTSAVAAPTNQFVMTPRTSRFGFATITPSSLGDVTTKVELDFAHDAHIYYPPTATGVSLGVGTTDQAVPRLRHLVMSFANWTFGYTWSNWLDLDAGAETVDWNGPIGQACDDTPRFTQIRYTIPFDKNNSLAISLEENQNDGKWYAGSVADANAVPDTKYPTVVAAYTYSDKWGHVALRGLEQYWGAYLPPTVANNSGTKTSAWAGAAQLSFSVNIMKDSLVGSIYSGKGLGAYGTDNGYDAFINVATTGLPYGPNSVQFTKSTGWQAGYTHVFTDDVRANIAASGLTYTDDPFNVAANPDLATLSDVKNSQYYFVNCFVKLTKTVEFGIEYCYEALKTFGSQAVQDSNNNPTNKLTESKVQFTMTATF